MNGIIFIILILLATSVALVVIVFLKSNAGRKRLVFDENWEQVFRAYWMDLMDEKIPLVKLPSKEELFKSQWNLAVKEKETVYHINTFKKAFKEVYEVVGNEEKKYLGFVYHKLGFSEEIIADLNSNDLGQIANALRMARHLELKEGLRFLYKLLDHKEQLIRVESLCSLFVIYPFSLIELSENGHQYNQWELTMVASTLMKSNEKYTKELRAIAECDDPILVKFANQVLEIQQTNTKGLVALNNPSSYSKINMKKVG